MSTIKPQTSYNDITGAKLTTGGATDDYRSGWDRIFGKKEPKVEPKEEPKVDQAVLDAKAAAKLAQRQSDDIREEWHEYCLAQEDRGVPFPTFKEFFENVFKPRNPDRAAWLVECRDLKTGIPTIPFEQYMAQRK